MAEVFISYSRRDLERVRPIVGAIEDAEYSVFWDRDVPPGLTWRQYIGNALEEAKCVIVVWSKNSIESDWVIEEADSARQRRILVPLTIEHVVPPLGFRAIQHEDLSEWQGELNHRGLIRILKSIATITGKIPREEAPNEPLQAENRSKKIQSDQKTAPELKTSFFSNLDPKIVLLTFAAFVLILGLYFWGVQQRDSEPINRKPGIYLKSPGHLGDKFSKDEISKDKIIVVKPNESDSQIYIGIRPFNYTEIQHLCLVREVNTDSLLTWHDVGRCDE